MIYTKKFDMRGINIGHKIRSGEEGGIRLEREESRPMSRSSTRSGE